MDTMAAIIVLRERRTEVGMTQVELARRSGIGQTTISRIESGTDSISLDVLDRLAKALGCEPGDLIQREGRKRR